MAQMTDPRELWTAAVHEGKRRAENCRPMPMGVMEGDRLIEVVEDGVCGFAWVNIRPARGPLVKWLKANNIGRTDSYAGGYTIWCGGYNQSMTRKAAWAYGVADVLTANGVTAYAHSRMD